MKPVFLFAVLILMGCDKKDATQHYKHSMSNSKVIEINSKKVEISPPRRVTHTYKQIIEGTIQEIFPLYCPVEELRWTENWDPKRIYSTSGVVEPDCVFITGDDDNEATWFVTDYDIAKGRVEMIKIVPKVTATKLVIDVIAISDSTTQALITYSLTSLGKEGDDILKEVTKENFDVSMQSWEKAMNHYIKTGEMLKGLPAF